MPPGIKEGYDKRYETGGLLAGNYTPDETRLIQNGGILASVINLATSVGRNGTWEKFARCRAKCQSCNSIRIIHIHVASSDVNKLVV